MYRSWLVYALRVRNIGAECEVGLPFRYEGLKFAAGDRADIIVEKTLIVERKVVDTLLPIFTTQPVSYLRMNGIKLGVLINFDVARLTDGIKRAVGNL